MFSKLFLAKKGKLCLRGWYTVRKMNLAPSSASRIISSPSLYKIQCPLSERDDLVENLSKRISEMEIKLVEKDDTIKNLAEKIKLVEKKLGNVINDTKDVLEQPVST